MRRVFWLLPRWWNRSHMTAPDSRGFPSMYYDLNVLPSGQRTSGAQTARFTMTVSQISPFVKYGALRFSH